MCGIFGVICSSDRAADRQLARELAISLLHHSETRGREAVGVAIHDGEQIHVLKQAGSVSDFLANGKFHRLIDGVVAAGKPGRPIAITGHSRLATNGAQSNGDNNQPVITHGTVALHNGIVVNDRQLTERYPGIAPQGELDSEVLAALLRTKLDGSRSLIAAARATFAEIEGSASLAMLFDDLDTMLLATNTGSLFQVTAALDGDHSVMLFASERFILQRVIEDKAVSARLGDVRLERRSREDQDDQQERVALEQIRAGYGLAVSLDGRDRRAFTLTASPGGDDAPIAPNGHTIEIVDHSSRVDRLRRCTRCILPETYPFIGFDEHGVCRYCRNWRRIRPKGEQALLDAVAPYRSKDGSPDVIVAFSGGRDSSYGLHYVKKVLQMNPVAFTYDWGMVTDLARRNQARLCGALGVEHIIRSADITAKRRYVRKNVEAWLKKPELGMVTLLMAGDKAFYAHARQLRDETGIKLVIFCTGNMIEEASYKTGLMGFAQDDDNMVLTKMSTRNKLAMLWYFAKNYAKNPAYINESLIDTANAFWQTFVVKDDFLYLYHYLPWDEDTIVGTIRREYNWETASDTQTTWRIGDGTAAFYNYIYGTMAGFTEDEAMLSNMVREGSIDRAEALRRGHEYSKPRWPSIREYAQLVGFSAEEALQIINAAPKLY
jgi:glucosamine--fructose-6-phosphate aminotransferase (isomerizing)